MPDDVALTKPATQVAQDQWARYEVGRNRGHRQYILDARKAERFYFGAGGQWSAEDRAALEALQRPVVEINTIFPAVNTALGEQLLTRLDINYLPKRGDASQEIATALSKVTKYICDGNDFQHIESQVFSDGLIQRRGFYDIRLDFADNLQGDILITSLDPLDVLIDADSQGYDPKDWRDVIVTRWLSFDEIEQMYGRKARIECENWRPLDDDFGSDGTDGDDAQGRNRFGNETGSRFWDATYDEGGQKRVRVLDRQHRIFTQQWCYVETATGEVLPIADDTDMAAIQAFAQENGYELAKLWRKRVRWTVTTRSTVLHDEWSPYDDFTIVGYFPYFRRGKSVSIVDNAISPQELFNKSISSFLHIVNSSANSGWIVEEGSLTNMSTDELLDVGMKTGLVVEYKKGTTPPVKIQPNQVPTGTDRLIDRGEAAVKTTTGISDAEQGLNSPEVSGVAIQSKQFQAKLQMGVPLDNLNRTRNLVARRVLSLLQRFYTEERTFHILEPGPNGKDQSVPVVVNQRTPWGTIVNDLTVGEYDVIATPVPTQATYEQGQFQQVMELRKVGVQIPDPEVVKYSTLRDKVSLAEKMSQGVTVEQQQMELAMQKMNLEQISATVELLKAKMNKEQANAANTNVQAMFGATNAANLIAQAPQIAPLADQMMLSAGFKDADAAPIVPSPQGIAPGQAVVPQNTSPNFPPIADSGAMTGIEGGSPV